MKMKVQVDSIELPRTLNSQNDRKPTFYHVKWQGNIRTSKFTLVYEYETPDGELFIAKGIHDYSPLLGLQWKTYPTMTHKYFESLGLEKQFGQFQRVKYEDFEYFITDGLMKNNATGEIEKKIILCKWTLVPLAVLPPIVPSENSDLVHFSSPNFRLVNDKIAAFSFEA